MKEKQKSFEPQFALDVLEDNRDDGYWVDSLDINNNRMPDIVAYGLNSGKLTWYENPNQPDENWTTKDWKKTLIATVEDPVGMTYGHIGSETYNDIVICSKYGGTMETIDVNGGEIHWYQNPLGKGGSSSDTWTKHYIGKAPGMHRLALGHFTQLEKLEVLALPVVGAPHDTHSPVAVKIFQMPDDVLGASEWKETLITDTYFHVIHDVAVRKFRHNHGDLRDSAILASQEGLTWLYYDGQWHMQNIAPGVPKTTESEGGGYWGCENVDVGRIGEDPFAYIATAGPFHGNVAAVYVKKSGNIGSIENATWTKHTLQIFENNNAPQVDGNGPVHHVICGDMDNDGQDEFLFSLRDKGVVYYKVTDLQNGVFTAYHVSEASAARCTIADFSGDGKLDFATIGYGVAGYYQADNVQLNVYYNNFADIPHDKKVAKGKQHGGTITLKHDTDSEVIANIIPSTEILAQYLITIFHFRISVVYMPALSTISANTTPIQLKVGTMIKVISGRIQIHSQDNVAPVIVGNTATPQYSRNMMVQSDEMKLEALRESVIIFYEPDFNTTMEDFPLIDSVETVNKTITFEPVEGLDKFCFKPYNDFWNMSGFTIKKLGLKLVHMQFWLADRKINCGIHDHSDTKGQKAFCEIHSCLINGTGSGSMFRSTKPANTPIDTIHRRDMKKIVVPSGFEHGPLWEWDSNGRPLRRDDGSVVYRAHAWIAGDGDPRSSLPSMDFWVAHELNPVIVESSM